MAGTAVGPIVGSSFPAGFVAQSLNRLAKQGANAECIAYMREALIGPSRNTVSRRRNVSGSFPSRKVGVTLGFESRTLESCAARKLEHDDDVWLYLDQPPKIKLRYSVNGRMRGYQVTPDFVVARQNEVILVECKRLAVVRERATQEPELYVQQDGRWTCPPADGDARRQGMRHEIWTEEDFCFSSVANAQFLDDYLIESAEIPEYEDALNAIQMLLAVRAKATITELLAELRLQAVLADHVHMAIAKEDVAVDLAAVPVALHDVCTVYRDRVTMAAFEACKRTAAADIPQLPLVHMQPGAQIVWDGVPWSILNIGAQQVSLSSDHRHQTLPLSLVSDLVRDGVIEGCPHIEKDEKALAVSNHLRAANESELREAHRRLELIEPFLNGTSRAPAGRSIRRYLMSYKRAEQQIGNGFVGLIPRTSKSGNRRGRLREDALKIVNEAIRELYLTPTQISVLRLYGQIHHRCEEAAIPCPSYGTINKIVKALNPAKCSEARSGHKVAYNFEPRIEETELASATEPVRPFERAHIDHTLLDLESIADQAWAGLGRVWITIMIDHFSRRVLGLHLTYAPPSATSAVCVLRDCVSRFGRLPDSIVLDGGSEFRSVWFKTICAWFHINVNYRPPAKPRYGTQIERFFGTLNTSLIYNLAGNTQNTRNVRQLTAEVAPSRHAIWTFSALHKVVEQYAFETYDQQSHRTLAMSPRQQFAMGMAVGGYRPHRLIADSETFHILTCPSTRKGTATVTLDGVKINYLYYNAPELVKHFRKSVPVRYDPENMAVAYAHVGGNWVRLRARHQTHLRFMTAHYVKLVSDEWRKRRSAVEKERLTDAKLIDFLLEVQQTETLLKERRQEAEERSRRVGLNPEIDDQRPESELSSVEAELAKQLEMQPAIHADAASSPFDASGIEIKTLEVC